MITVVGRKKCITDDLEEVGPDFCIRIDRRDKCILWIERNHFFITLDCIRNIGSFDLSFIWEVSWMDDITDRYLVISVGFDDFLSVLLCIWCSLFGCEKDGYIFFIWVFCGYDGEDVLLYYIIGFCIDRDNDDVF